MEEHSNMAWSWLTKSFSLWSRVGDFVMHIYVNFSLFLYVWVCPHLYSMCKLGAHGGIWILWNRSYRWLWLSCGCWGLNHGPLQFLRWQQESLAPQKWTPNTQAAQVRSTRLIPKQPALVTSLTEDVQPEPLNDIWRLSLLLLRWGGCSLSLCHMVHFHRDQEYH